jgi:hypothetical protein
MCFVPKKHEAHAIRSSSLKRGGGGGKRGFVLGSDRASFCIQFGDCSSCHAPFGIKEMALHLHVTA